MIITEDIVNNAVDIIKAKSTLWGRLTGLEFDEYGRANILERQREGIALVKKSRKVQRPERDWVPG